jgi:ATP-dependent helicase HrpB
MLTSDLTPLALTLAQGGPGDPAEMAWIDPPPAAAMAAAHTALAALGALDGEGRITPHGRAMAALPMEPALAHMLLFAAARGQADEAARLALLLQERGLGGRGEDLALRLERWGRERGGRAEASRALAARWAASAVKVLRQAQHERPKFMDNTSPAHAELVEASGATLPLGVLLAEAFPDRIARARGASGEEWLASGGRGYRLDPASSLVRAPWLVIGDAQGEAKGARITSALALEEADVTRHLAHRIESRHALTWNAAERRVEARLERRLGAVVLARVPDPSPDPAAVEALLLERLRAEGLGLLPLGDKATALIERGRYAGLEALAVDALLAEADE